MANLPAVTSSVSLKAATAPKIGVAFSDLSTTKTVNAVVRGAGAVTATIYVMGSNLPEDDSFIKVGEIALTGTDLAVGGIVPEAKWAFTRLDLIAISGTNAKVDAAIGATKSVIQGA